MREQVILPGMSRALWYDCLIDEQPVLVPDDDMDLAANDLDSDESGRDEGGFMHRIVLREGIRTMPLVYSHLNHEDYRYMESLFRGKHEFTLKYRDPGGKIFKYTAYRSKYGITLHNHSTGIYKNYKFNIIEC